MTAQELSPAARLARQHLPAATDKQHQEVIAAIIEAGKAIWVFDPAVNGVLGLVDPAGNGEAALAILFTDEPELEVSPDLYELAEDMGL